MLEKFENAQLCLLEPWAIRKPTGRLDKIFRVKYCIILEDSLYYLANKMFTTLKSIFCIISK